MRRSYTTGHGREHGMRIEVEIECLHGAEINLVGLNVSGCEKAEDKLEKNIMRRLEYLALKFGLLEITDNHKILLS